MSTPRCNTTASFTSLARCAASVQERVRKVKPKQIQALAGAPGLWRSNRRQAGPARLAHAHRLRNSAQGCMIAVGTPVLAPECALRQDTMRRAYSTDPEGEMRIGVLVSVVALVVSLVAAGMPFHRAMADISVCTNCSIIVDSGNG
jgi:hypothetical protein